MTEPNSRVDLVLRRPTEEFITKEELKSKIDSKEKLNHYISYEVSGLVHLGQLLTALKIADLQKAGVNTSILMADFHTVINNKLGSDAEFIKEVANKYFRRAMEIGIKMGGGNPKKTRFVLASDIYDNSYWAKVIKIGKETTLSRAMRSISIMGRQEKKSIPTAWVLYPLMQAGDIFFQNINIAHAGMDQRRIHVVAREVGEKISGYKPMALHNHMLLGLHKPPVWPVPKNKEDKWQEFKMSKSVKGSAVFVNDSKEDVVKKIKGAFCPKESDYNPVLDWIKYLVFTPQFDSVFKIERPEKYGGDVEFLTYSEVKKAFLTGELHPSDMKSGLADYTTKLLQPFRNEFENNTLVEELKQRITR